MTIILCWNRPNLCLIFLNLKFLRFIFLKCNIYLIEHKILPHNLLSCSIITVWNIFSIQSIYFQLNWFLYCKYVHTWTESSQWVSVINKYILSYILMYVRGKLLFEKDRGNLLQFQGIWGKLKKPLDWPKPLKMQFLSCFAAAIYCVFLLFSLCKIQILV